MNTVVYGLTYAVSQSTVFLMYAIVFRFGAFQVTLPEDHVVYQPFQNIFVAFIALVFGAVGAGQAGAFAPNYAKAKLSANRIFALLDREPVIDSYSEEGAKPVSEKRRLLCDYNICVHKEFLSHLCHFCLLL